MALLNLFLRKLEGQQCADNPRKSHHVIRSVQLYNFSNFRIWWLGKTKLTGNSVFPSVNRLSSEKFCKLVCRFFCVACSRAQAEVEHLSCWPIKITRIHTSDIISTFQQWLNLRSRTRAGTSRFSRLAWWARKATTSMNLGRSGYHKCFNFFFNLLLLFTFYLLTLLFLFLFFDPALPVVGNVAEEGVTPVPEGRTNSQGWGLTVDLDWLT